MMGRYLPRPLIGILTSLLMTITLLFWAIPFLPVAILKALIPIPSWRRWCGRYLVWIAGEPWLGSNILIFRLLHGRRTNVAIQGSLDRQHSWLLISNHRSWSDILLLLDALYLKVPFPRFFLKRELFWVPLVGLICWALDMPFMKRQGRSSPLSAAVPTGDLEATRQFCEKYRLQPVTVVNFIEGTRYSPGKRTARDGYQHLLRPRAAGLSFTLNAMGEQFAGLIDVTIAYRPTRRALLWSFLCGGQRQALLEARVLPLPAQLVRGDYAGDREFRKRFQGWIAALWSEKDVRLGRAGSRE